MEYSEAEIESYLVDIWNGDIDLESLPEDLYDAIRSQYKDELFKRFGGLDDFEEGSKEYDLLLQMTENIDRFSAAKLATMTSEFIALADEHDNSDDYLTASRERFGVYSGAYEQTEMNNVTSQAYNASIWMQIENDKEDLPYLEYDAVMDDNTSDICAGLNGLTLSVDDPQVSIVSPQNHNNCRCLWRQVENPRTMTKEHKEGLKYADENIDEPFRNNVGKTGMIFGKGSGYFDVANETKGLAKRNFNLPINND